MRARRAPGVDVARGQARRARGFGRLRFGGCRGARGRLEHRRQGDAEHAAERAQNARRLGLGVLGGRGKQGQGFRRVQQVVELRGAAGGVVAELDDQPGFGARDVDAALAAGLVRAFGARGRLLAGGEAGEQAGQALMAAHQAGVQGQV